MKFFKFSLFEFNVSSFSFIELSKNELTVNVMYSIHANSGMTTCRVEFCTLLVAPLAAGFKLQSLQP